MAKKNGEPSYRDLTTYLGLRLEPALKEEVEKAAKAEDRSVSNWCVRVLTREIERLKNS